jgi:alpha-L-fucosidase 2
MRGRLVLFLDFLVPHPEDGYLMTCPATSPENTPVTPGNYRLFDKMNGASYSGRRLCYGTVIDTQILVDLFDQVAKAAAVLDVDRTFRKQVLQVRAKLPPMKVGTDGLLPEKTTPESSALRPARPGAWRSWNELGSIPCYFSLMPKG